MARPGHGGQPETFSNSSTSTRVRSASRDRSSMVAVISSAAVALDWPIRVSSPTFGKWFSIELSAENKRLVYVPVGFAHGFATLSDYCEVQYKQTDYYRPETENGIAWNDPDVGIVWPYDSPVLSRRDQQQMNLREYRTAPAFD